eukprot:5653962-Prymnesium_polylepis.2
MVRGGRDRAAHVEQHDAVPRDHARVHAQLGEAHRRRHVPKQLGLHLLLVQQALPEPVEFERGQSPHGEGHRALLAVVGCLFRRLLVVQVVDVDRGGRARAVDDAIRHVADANVPQVLRCAGGAHWAFVTQGGDAAGRSEARMLAAATRGAPAAAPRRRSGRGAAPRARGRMRGA